MTCNCLVLGLTFNILFIFGGGGGGGSASPSIVLGGSDLPAPPLSHHPTPLSDIINIVSRANPLPKYTDINGNC